MKQESRQSDDYANFLMEQRIRSFKKDGSVWNLECDELPCVSEDNQPEIFGFLKKNAKFPGVNFVDTSWSKYPNELPGNVDRFYISTKNGKYSVIPAAKHNITRDKKDKSIAVGSLGEDVLPEMLERLESICAFPVEKKVKVKLIPTAEEEKACEDALSTAHRGRVWKEKLPTDLEKERFDRVCEIFVKNVAKNAQHDVHAAIAYYDVKKENNQGDGEDHYTIRPGFTNLTWLNPRLAHLLHSVDQEKSLDEGLFSRDFTQEEKDDRRVTRQYALRQYEQYSNCTLGEIVEGVKSRTRGEASSAQGMSSLSPRTQEGGKSFAELSSDASGFGQNDFIGSQDDRKRKYGQKMSNDESYAYGGPDGSPSSRKRPSMAQNHMSPDERDSMQLPSISNMMSSFTKKGNNR